MAQGERFSAKARPGLDPGAIRFDVQENALKPKAGASDSIGTELALVGAAGGTATTWDRMSPPCPDCMATMTRDTRFLAKKPL